MSNDNRFQILTQLGERKALSEADIFKYLVLRFKVGNDYGKVGY